ASPAVAQRPGPELAYGPHGGIDGDEDAEIAQRQGRAAEEQREEAAGQAIVEIVHEPGLAHTEQSAIRPERSPQQLRGTRPRYAELCAAALLERRMVRRLAHENRGERQAQERDREPQIRG